MTSRITDGFEDIESCAPRNLELERQLALTYRTAQMKFPKTESLAADAFQVVQDEFILDGNARQNLATFRQI